MTKAFGNGRLDPCAASIGNAANNPEPMDGYSPAHAATERDWETKFRNIPDPNVLRDSMQHLSARPHNVGSPYDKENAEWMLAKFKEYGFDAHIETFEVLFPTPKERRVELLEPTHFVAKLQEPAAERRSNVAADRRAVAHLQRVFHRRRCHRPAGLRELRHARRLRAARAAGSFGEGRDRDCALRRRLARHQAQSRGRTWSRGLHHLLRSEG